MSATFVLSTLLVCCVLYSAHAQSEMDMGVTVEAVVMTSAPPTTEPPITEFSIELYHRESSTSSISIVWRPHIPEGISIEKYHIETTKKDSDSLITSPDLPADTTEYIVDDLIKDAQWRVCVIAAIANDTHSNAHEQCLNSFTIPYIRDDSVYVLAIVILVIATLVLIGYLSWRCAIQAAEKRAAEAEEEEDESDEDKKLQ